MKLEELLVQKPEFKIESKQKMYTLRVPNLEDRVKFKEILGDESKIQEIFNNLQWDIIAKLVYRLLVEKEDFVARPEKGYNDDGEPVTYLITGPALLMRSMNSIDEAMKMLGALVTALRLGDPLIDQAITNMTETEKKSPTKNRTGQKSTTQSQANTDSLPTSSVS